MQTTLFAKGCALAVVVLSIQACGDGNGLRIGPPPVTSFDPDYPEEPGAPPALDAPRTTARLETGWEFVQGDTISDEEMLARRPRRRQLVRLPHAWSAQDGTGWYRLELPSPAAGARHFLEIGAASAAADVWLDGQKLGRHEGAFTAFRFDVTDVSKKEGKHVLLVKVDDTAARDERDFMVSGGLYRHVSLISTRDAAHIDLGDLGGTGVTARTIGTAGGEATVEVATKLRSDADAPGDYVVHVILLDRTGAEAARSEQQVTLEPGAVRAVSRTLTVPGAHLWQGVADPYLYTLVVELRRMDGTAIDRVAERYGIRQVRFDPDAGFFLNGQHVRLNGVAMHQDKIGRGWAITERDVDHALATIRAMGANAVRLARHPFARYVYERASELGLLVWADASVGSGRCDEASIERARRELTEQIRQQIDHASIAMWGVGDDATCPDLVRALHETAKAEDPSRPTVSARDVTDLVAPGFVHDRAGDDVGDRLDALHARAPETPLGVAAFGAAAPLAEDEAAEARQAAVHERTYAALAARPYLWGAFVWSMFDFGSAREDLGVETTGLVAFDHEARKDAFFFYRANWSDEPVTYIAGRRQTTRAGAVVDVKVYGNAETITLSVNGRPAGTKSAAECPFRTCVFSGVPLDPGTNRVEAVGLRAGAEVADAVAWTVEER